LLTHLLTGLPGAAVLSGEASGRQAGVLPLDIGRTSDQLLSGVARGGCYSVLFSALRLTKVAANGEYRCVKRVRRSCGWRGSRVLQGQSQL